MVIKLNKRNTIDLLEFINQTPDKYQDFYITKDRQRLFLNDCKLIEKVISKQEIYAIEDKDIKAILLIYREKGFRTYIRFLVSDNKYLYDLLKWLNWNINQELYIKAKKNNPIINIAQKKGFIFLGARGTEILLKREKREIKHDSRHYLKD